MKKQDALTLRSSSYRHENSAKNPQAAKNIGCMSCIFHCIYKYNNRRGKFITSGKQQESNANVSNNDNYITCDGHRSPTLPAEIRRGSNVKTTEMGFLAEAEEKRRKLIEALEKCDEDLKELKKIIDVVKGSVGVNVDQHDDHNKINGDLQPSPVSVLDHFNPSSVLNSSASSSSSSGCGYTRGYANGRAVQQQKKKQKKKPGEEEIMSNICMVEKMQSTETIFQTQSQNITAAVISPMWGSKAMINSVNEVCRDIAFGEKRENGRIVLALQDNICRDLIDEFVKEFVSFCMYSLPFAACKRRLIFQ